MEEILSRLRQLRARMGLKQGEFGKCLKMPQNSYSQIETGINSLKDRHIALICLTFEVNENWLRTGEGEMFTKESKALPQDPIIGPDGELLEEGEAELIRIFRKLEEHGQEKIAIYAHDILKAQGQPAGKKPDKKEKYPIQNPVSLEVKEPEPAYDTSTREKAHDNVVFFDDIGVIEIPMVGSTAAGKRIDFGDLDPNPPTRPWAAPLIKGKKKDYYCVHVKGTSMTEADIKDGDYALLKHTEDAENGEIMLVRHDDSSTLKRIKIIKGSGGQNDVFICWEDGSGRTEKLEGDGFGIQGRLIAVERKSAKRS